MAGERQLIVKIVGDDKSLQAAFARSTASTKAFSANVSKSLSGGISVGKSFDPLLARTKESQAEADALSKRLAALDNAAAGASSGASVLSGGLAAMALRAGLAGIAINATYQGVRHLQDALEATGTEAFTTSGKLRNFGASLLTGDIVGAFQALEAQPKTLDELGISASQASFHFKSLQKVADGTAASLRDQAVSADGTKAQMDAYSRIVEDAGTGNRELAGQLVQQVASMQAAQNAAEALADSTARLGTVFRTSTGDAVTFKGAVDDLAGPRGPGAVDAINAALEQAQGGFGKQISPGAARTAKETIARASGDLQAVLKLQQADQAAAKQALAASNAVGKDREALNQSLAEATAAVITTQKQIKAQNDATTKTVAEVDKADPAAQWAKIVAGLQLDVDRSGLTKRLGDDLDALKDLKGGLERQIKAGVDVTGAQSKLVTVVGQIAAKQGEIRQAAADALQARQFRALGLTGTGDDVIPGIGDLRKHLGQAADSLGTEAAPKLRSQLSKIAKVLAGGVGDVTVQTRKKIAELLDTFNGGFDKIADGPRTKAHALNASKFLDGLGLGRELEKELRARLSSFNSAGLALAGSQRPTGAFRAPSAAAGGDVVINLTTTLDGQVIAQNTTRHQQKTARRNPRKKTGLKPGI